MLSATSFSVKLGNAIAGSLGVVLLGAVGYVANEVQNASTKLAMSGVINLMPAVLFLISMIPFFMITMNKAKAAENQAILQERHANKEE